MSSYLGQGRPAYFWYGSGMDQRDRKAHKAYEARLRRMAERQNLRLVKCRRRDPYAIGFGTYRVETLAGDPAPGFATDEGLTLKEVEALLTTPREQRLTGKRS
jgi:hypothetical protein